MKKLRDMDLRSAWVIAVASVAVSMVIAAMAGLTTALPEIALATGADSGEMTWIMDGYTLALAALLLPAGALGLVQGTGAVGAALVESDVDMIAFTGSIATGQAIMRAAAAGMKRLVLELDAPDPPTAQHGQSVLSQLHEGRLAPLLARFEGGSLERRAALLATFGKGKSSRVAEETTASILGAFGGSNTMLVEQTMREIRKDPRYSAYTTDQTGQTVMKPGVLRELQQYFKQRSPRAVQQF